MEKKKLMAKDEIKGKRKTGMFFPTILRYSNFFISL